MGNSYIAENLKFLRQVKGLSTGEVAKKIKVTEELIVGWESGLIDIEPKAIMVLAKVYGVDTITITNKDLIKDSQSNKTTKIGRIFFHATSLLAFIFTFMAMALIPAFRLYYERVLLSEIKFFDLIPTKLEMGIVGYLLMFVVFVVVYNVVNSICLLCSKSLRQGKYSKINNIANLVLNTIALLFWVAVWVINKDLDTDFTSIWLTCAFAVQIISIITLMVIDFFTNKRENKVFEETTKGSTKATVKEGKLVLVNKVDRKWMSVLSRVLGILAVVFAVFIFFSIGMMRSRAWFDVYRPDGSFYDDYVTYECPLWVNLVIVGSTLAFCVLMLFMIIKKWKSVKALIIFGSISIALPLIATIVSIVSASNMYNWTLKRAKVYELESNGRHVLRDIKVYDEWLIPIFSLVVLALTIITVIFAIKSVKKRLEENKK